MTNITNGDNVRQILMEAIKEHSDSGRKGVKPDRVFEAVIRKINPMPVNTERDFEVKRVVLGYWNEMMRVGYLNLGNIEAHQSWDAGPCFVTELGQVAQAQADRDPMNPAGYLAYLDKEAVIDSVARSYVEEALNTYRACCYKATAVLIGAAVELLVLNLRDALRDGLNKQGVSLPQGLDAWQVKTALEASAKQILPDLKGDAKRKGDESLRKLGEDADSRLYPMAAEFRRLRNSAGHPAALEPVLSADAHANLLLFPVAAKLLRRLTDWTAAYYI